MNITKLLTLFVFVLTFHQLSEAQVTADFTADNTSGCQSLVVHFANKSTANTDSLLWNLGNGLIVKDLNDVGTTYIIGSYTATLTAYKNGVSSIKSVPINVYKSPVAAFSVDKTKICLPYSSTFTDLSTAGDGTINKWSWDMRNGDILSARNPSYKYTRPGTYDVLLSVTDIHGCESTVIKTAYIVGKDKPVPGFSANPSTSCIVPVTVNFTNQTTGGGILTYNWNFGGTNSSTEENPAYTYNSNGTYHVKLSVTSDFGCTASLDVAAVTIGTVTASGTITQNGKVIANNDYICAGEINFQDNSGNSSILWDFGDGNSSSLNSGNYDLTSQGQSIIKLIASPGTSCSNTKQWIVNIEKPVASFDFNQKACTVPILVPFTNNSENASSYIWKFPHGPDVTATNPSYNFTNLEVPVDANPYVIHEELLFDIGLIAKSPHGCVDTSFQKMTIHLPTAIYTLDNVSGCAPMGVNFTSASLSDDPITSYEWSFGDGKENTTTNSTVSHAFSDLGVFPTKLIIFSGPNNTCRDTSCILNVRTGKKPNTDFSFTPASLCESAMLTLTNKTPLEDNVDFGQYIVDGLNVADFSISNPVQYKMKSSVGTVPIKLIAGNNGCFSEKSYTTENTGPFGSFNFTTDCANPLTYTFNGKINAIGSTSFVWDFGDGQTDNTSLTPVHTFTTSGDKTVTFTATNSTGCNDIVKQNVRVRKGVIDFTAPANGCADIDIAFTATPTNMQAELCADRYLWKFGDDSPALLTDIDLISHSFENHGAYSVKLIALYENGCKDSIAKSIHIFKPQAAISTDQVVGCSPLQVIYTDISTPDINPIVKWDWDYGDGNVLSFLDAGNISQNIFVENGSYITNLNVTDAIGCIGKATVEIGVATPSADFYADNTEVCSDKPVTFTYTFDNPDSAVWNFGDGTTFTSKGSNQLPAKHTYKVAKSYTVTLDIYKYKCKDTLPREGYITVQNADAHFSVSDTASTCYTRPISFDHTPSPDISYGLWDFGDQGHTSDYFSHRAYTYPEPGTFNISLLIHTTFGCEDKYQKSIKITGPNGNFSVSTNKVCKGESIVLTSLDTVNLDHFEWDLGDGRTMSGSISPYQFSYKDSGVKNVGIILYGHDLTCHPEKTNIITVAKVTAGFVSPGSIVCSDIPIPFNNNSIGQASQFWDFGDNTTSTILSPSHNFSTGQYNVYLAVKDINGCTDTLKLPLSVLPTPTVKLEFDKSLCAQNKAILNAIGTSNKTSISWSPVTGLSDTDKFQTIATPEKSTQYKVTLTYNGSSCSKSDSIIVYRPIAHVIPHDDYHSSNCNLRIDTVKTSIGNPIYVDFCDSSDIKSWKWMPETDLSCTNCLNPQITAKHNITYLAILNEPNECFTDTIKVVVLIDTTNQTSHVPSAFRPGSGGINSILKVEGRGINKVIEFKIYNRWGNVVFSSTDITQGWDGKYQGKEQPIDSYIYTLKTEQFNGMITTEKGTILLLR